MTRAYVHFAVVLLAACAPVPRLGPAPVPRAPSQVASLSGDAAWPADSWWRGFGDAQLDGLIDEALAGSPDVAAAAARIASADAFAQQAGAALGPSIGLDASAGVTKQSENLGIPPAFVPKGVQDTARIAASMSFSPDLWGKNRSALSAARGDAAQARLLLTSGIAGAYADLFQQFADRDLTVAALATRTATAVLTAQRVRVGSETLGGQRQAEARVPQARADVTALDEAIALTRHRLAALVGNGPDRGSSITRPTLRNSPAGLQATAGIDLVGRRPDLVATRLRAEAAGDRIKVARADFYPNFNLTALIGLQSLGLGNLLQSGSSFGNGGLAISLPILDAGRIQGRYRGARSEYDAAVARYDATLLTALREVADAATSRAAVDTRIADLRAAVAAASDARRVAELRYRGGLANQLPVLTADDTLLTLQRMVADAEARRTALDIALIRALGGGYRETVQIGAR